MLLLLYHSNSCSSGLIAGMGFTVSSAGGNVTRYGGGLDLRFASADAAANDKRCNGSLLGGGTQQAKYAQIGNVTATCRRQCNASKTGYLVYERPAGAGRAGGRADGRT